MASGPNWNPRRGTWYVQFWQGGWHRKVVAHAPSKWKKGDPEPRVPPEAHAGFTYWENVEKMARERGEQGLPISLRDFLMEHLASYRNERTRQTAEVAIRKFLAWADSQNFVRYDQIDKKACRRWVDHAAQTLSRATVATHRGYIAAAWGRQVDEDEIEKSPWKGVEAKGEDRTKPRRSWSPQQFRQLLDACDDWLKTVLIVGVHTGLRIRALMHLEWDHWTLGQADADRFGYIHVPRSLDKARKGYTVPVSRELHDLLIRRIGKNHPRFILTGQAGRPIIDKSHTDWCIRAACRRAGLPEPQSPNHHMRRTFGRWATLGHLTGTPVPLYVVSRWLGHNEPNTTLRYLAIEEHESAKLMVPDWAPYSPGEEAGDSATTPPATHPSSRNEGNTRAATPDASPQDASEAAESSPHKPIG